MCIGLENMPKATSNTHLGTPVSLPFPWNPPSKLYCGPHLLILNSNQPHHIYKLCCLGYAILLYHTPHTISCVFIMGISSHPSLVSLSLKDLLEANRNSSYGCLRTKKKGVRRPTRRVLMKRRGGCRRGSNGIRRRVRTLKTLVPNSHSLGLDGLFRETANYILSLQTRVRVMQVMVNVLTPSHDWFICL